MSSDAATRPEVAAVRMDYDHYDVDFVADPIETWERMRRCPVVRSETHGGFYVLSRYEDVFAAGTDTATFTSERGVNTPPLDIPKMLPIEIDPPNHREYRKMLNPPLTVNALKAHEATVREIAVSLAEPLAEMDEVEICAAFTIPFPTRVACAMLGFPEADLPRLTEWTDILTSSVGDERAVEAGPAMAGYLAETITRRRTEPARNDLISVLLDGRAFDRPLEDTEIIPTMMLLLFGGLHTTTSALGGMLRWLAEHPERRAWLMAHPEKHTRAIEEFLRVTAPATHITRETTKPVVIAGCPIPANSRILFNYGAANRDEAMFDYPDEVDLERSPNHHLAFGIGPHHCVGAHLGRMMLRVAIEELLPCLGDFRVTEGTSLEWLAGQARGIRRMSLTLDHESTAR